MPFALLFAALTLVLDLLHAATRRQRDLAVEVVVPRQQVRMYQRLAQRAPVAATSRIRAVSTQEIGHATRR